MVTGRAGSALAAELGIMRITEQIDALTVSGAQPDALPGARPILAAGLVTLPLMTAVFDVVGIFGGYLVGVKLFGPVSREHYFGEMQAFVDIRRHHVGLLEVALVRARRDVGLHATRGSHVGHGAEGVARATTRGGRPRPRC